MTILATEIFWKSYNKRERERTTLATVKFERVMKIERERAIEKWSKEKRLG